MDPSRPDDLLPGSAIRPLAEFLAGSEVCPVARLDSAGVVLAANEALRCRLPIRPAPRLSEALSPSGVASWHAALVTLERTGASWIGELEFARVPTRPTQFRCLLVRVEDGSLWVLGTPIAGTKVSRRAGLSPSRRELAHRY